MPIETNSGTQVSVLMKTDGENVCAPVVDGKPATVLEYPDAFFEGFDTAYRRCLAEKENLEKDVRELFSDVPVRLMVRNTQRYADLLENLYKAGVLSTEEAHTTFSLRLEKALMSGMDRELYRGVCLSEKDAVLRGDIPYFYTSGDSTGVFDADGRVGDLIRVSGVSASLKRISRMSGRELLFEKKLIREALDIVPVRIARDDPDISGRKYDALPVRSSEALSAQLAASEAGEIIKMICSRMIPAPNGD